MTLAVNSLLSGSANAFLTLRVGMIAKAYCGSLVAQPRTKLRRSATAEAARLLSGIVKESGARVPDCRQLGEGALLGGTTDESLNALVVRRIAVRRTLLLYPAH